MHTSYYILIAIFLTVLIIQYFFPSYLKEKGKNLATKEDIKELTKIVESAKIEYLKQLEDHKSELNKNFEFNKLRIENKKLLYSLCVDVRLKIINGRSGDDGESYNALVVLSDLLKMLSTHPNFEREFKVERDIVLSERNRIAEQINKRKEGETITLNFQKIEENLISIQDKLER